MSYFTTRKVFLVPSFDFNVKEEGKILKLINVLRSKDIDEGIDLANVYENWYEEICNSFIKFGSKTYNNALCEGINNKIEAIKRSSFGILNFSHLRARVFFLLEI